MLFMILIIEQFWQKKPQIPSTMIPEVFEM